jgi:hypothetical protein
LKANVVTWKAYKETDEDKKVYSKMKKDKKKSLASVLEHDCDNSFDSEESDKGKKNVKFDVDN